MKAFEAVGIRQVSPDFQLFGNVSYALARYLKTTIASVTVQDDQSGLAVRASPVTSIHDWISTFGVNYNYHGILPHGDEFNARLEANIPASSRSQSISTALPTSARSPGFVQQSAVIHTIPTPPARRPFVIFNLDLNVLNIFNTRDFQYFYYRVSPASCGRFASGPYERQSVSSR